ncbi:hypothetical protein PCANC_05853 [Puccinia coronata f. sp. avenae]|uniref:Cx9C motif-containing protein 4, mitochondrial n=1 Tax=Puccinia coronata f. sp. avenae TaxID=200324 RepID=A0A2N5SST5_9BASI|nr:hypothetical protein PCANC_12999 [Puccinia coronata f. sp. avenae]PLW22497.1 hypothetical protein PCASD_10821 [Puccinia coronata f. sp. avenae]PLW47390.1 hypothetical protein PCANC_05853 [Puccinia coronata f. sp. avenae]PLW49432.1 hypothetical protein PCASD_01935 [Puccinia coronata f. sp. avenae]
MPPECLCETKINQSPPCQLEACKLQGCLNRHTYEQEKCDQLLINLYQCCSELYNKQDRTQSHHASNSSPADSNSSATKDQILSSACPLERVVAKKLASIEKLTE